MVLFTGSPPTRTAFAPPGPNRHFVPRHHRYYAVLRLPRSHRPQLRSPSPLAYRFVAVRSHPLSQHRHPIRQRRAFAPPGLVTGSLSTGIVIHGETRVSQVSGPPACAAPWSYTPPGVPCPSPLPTGIAPWPSGRVAPCAPRTAHFRGRNPTAQSLAYLRIAGHVTVTVARLASRSPGSAFRSGIRTR